MGLDLNHGRYIRALLSRGWSIRVSLQRGRTYPGLASTRGRIADGGILAWRASTKCLSLVVGLDLNHGWYIPSMSHERFIRVSLHVVAHVRSG